MHVYGIKIGICALRKKNALLLGSYSEAYKVLSQKNNKIVLYNVYYSTGLNKKRGDMNLA